MNPAQHVLAAMIRFYRWALSPAKTALFGPLGRCRFHPTCSAYALEAVCAHGAIRGSWLAVRRLFRCHPWGGCGFDPVPPSTAYRQVKSNNQFSRSLGRRPVGGDPQPAPRDGLA